MLEKRYEADGPGKGVENSKESFRHDSTGGKGVESFRHDSTGGRRV